MILRQFFKNRADGTNLLADEAGLNLCGYTFEQTTASDTWVALHNNDSTILAVQVYIDDILVEPQDIIINNSNKFTITFSEEVTGIVNFLVYKFGDCVEITPSP
jgi:hypothetical protein